jgi:hypothetical protein
MMVVIAYLHFVGGGVSVLVTLAITSAIWLLSHCVTKAAGRQSLMNTLAVAGVAYWVLAHTLLNFGAIKSWRVDGDSILIIAVAVSSVFIRPTFRSLLSLREQSGSE